MAGRAGSQPQPRNPGKGRPLLQQAREAKWAEYYGPPNQTRMKSFLQGSGIQPLDDERFLITEPRLDTFSVKGDRTLAVQAPQCLMDRRQGTVNSAGPMQAQLGAKFSISGIGFLYAQTNSDLFISNNVRSLLQPDLLPSAPAQKGTNSRPIEILSRQFEYSTNYGQAVWRGNVRVDGDQLSLTSGELTANLPATGSGLQDLASPSGPRPAPSQEKPAGQAQLESITAVQNVSVDYSGVHATGDQAVYTTATDLLHLTGHPTWRAQSRDGSADDLVLGRTNQVLVATGHAILRMPGQSLEKFGLQSPRGPQPTNAPPATNQVVEVSARSYDLHTNLAEFAGPVQVTERAGNEVKGTMTCGRLTVWLGPTNELDRMVAQDVVVIQQVDRRFFADKAVYEGAQGVMELTGAPRWEAGERRGQGRVIELYSKPESMLVRGDASMLLPATELASADIASHATPGGAAPVARPSPARPAATPAGTNGPMAEITAEEYTVTPEVGVFRRHAHLLHPQMDWTSDTIAVEWPAEAATHHIHAEGTVWFQMLSQNDRMLEGQGDQADYTCTITNGLTNEFMVLTGPPALLVLSHKPPDWAPSDNPAQFLPTADPTQSEADKNTVTDSLITMDLVRQHITTSRGSQWAIRISTPPGKTNSTEIPKFQIRKIDQRRMRQP